MDNNEYGNNQLSVKRYTGKRNYNMAMEKLSNEVVKFLYYYTFEIGYANKSTPYNRKMALDDVKNIFRRIRAITGSGIKYKYSIEDKATPRIKVHIVTDIQPDIMDKAIRGLQKCGYVKNVTKKRINKNFGKRIARNMCAWAKEKTISDKYKWVPIYQGSKTQRERTQDA